MRGSGVSAAAEVAPEAEAPPAAAPPAAAAAQPVGGQNGSSEVNPRALICRNFWGTSNLITFRALDFSALAPPEP